MPGFPNKAVSGLSLLLQGSRRIDRVMEGVFPVGQQETQVSAGRPLGNVRTASLAEWACSTR